MIVDSGYPTIKWSEFKDLDKDTKVLLIDTLGDLPFFYCVSDIAFVGGSLFSVGGHNLLEPASFEKPVLTGEFLQNVQEISSELVEAGGLLLVKNSEELSEHLNNLFADDSAKEKMVSGAGRVMQENKGSIDNLMRLIKPLIEN
tara:strand:- start:359 stop:790 length:432 start_codon:yes stop_codon:yes gene_type:complete